MEGDTHRCRKLRAVMLVTCSSKAFLLMGNSEATKVIFTVAQLLGKVKMK